MSRRRIAGLLATFAGLLALTAVLAAFAFPMAGTAWADGKPLRVEGKVQPPKVLSKTPPEYPENARENRVEGTTAVEITIDKQGKVQDPIVKQSSGNEELDKAAVQAVSAWAFEPATLDGKPVAVYYTITIRFKADE